ncbi:MAG: general secretion pathway protein GspK [Synergistaceae bacterium]|jgi:type II secretory pathway component PulK|nr:general secretion pathway protein GspK [Synergistaceae bacterium]
MKRRSRSSEGFILVTVLLVSALFLGAALSYAWFARQEMRRSSGAEFAAVSRGAALMALREVSGWIAEDSSEYISPHRPLYSGIVPFKLEYGDFTVTLFIEPLDDKIPINALFLPDGVTIKNEYAYSWSRIWEILGQDCGALALDFLDADRSPRPGSREDEGFPNRPVSDLGQLLRLGEMKRELLYVSGDSPALERFVTVYGDAGININTAPAWVIAIMDPGIGSDAMEGLIRFRDQNAIKSAEDLSKIAGFSSTVITRLKNVINYKSEFFAVRIKVAGGAGERSFEAVLRRAGGSCSVVRWRE